MTMRNFVRTTAMAVLWLTAVAAMAEKKWVDVTLNHLKNPSFTTTDRSDWQISGQAGALAAISYSCMEMWNGYISLTHQSQNVPNGHYRLSVQAFYRTRGHDRAYKEHQDGSEVISGFLFANDVQVAVQSEYNFHFDYNPGRSYTPDGVIYFPNSMETAQMAFTTGAYWNTLEFDVTDGQLSFGLYNDEAQKHSDNWLIFDNFKLELEEEVFLPGAQSIVINELQAANVDMMLSPAFNFDGWIELYNPTDGPLTLGGCYLSDDANDLRKWRLPDAFGNLPARGFRQIWMGSNNINPMQAPFKLDCEGGTVYLSNALGQLITSESYPEAISRAALARTTDGGSEWAWTATPTPAASNAAATYATERTDEPTATPQSRLFDSPFRLYVKHPEGTTLRYTTDGTTPTENHGYTSDTGIFTVNSTCTYRFRLFEEGKLPSAVVTRTFIERSHDFTLPIISVTTDDRYLYDDSIGVYVRGVNGCTGNGQSEPANWNMDWDRPVNFQYILPDVNTAVVNQDVDFAISGGWTRGNSVKSFKLKADRVYENQNAFSYPFFSAKPFIKNKTLQVRYGGNDTWCRIKDAALHEIIQRSGIDVDVMSYQPAVHFINGQYKGLINVREPNNKDFAYANWGLSKAELEVYEQSPDSGAYMMLGRADVLNRLYELSKTAARADSYAEIRQLLDIDEFVNYMAAELFLCSWDWPDNNLKAYRKTDGGRYRITFFDLDAAFGTEGREWDEEGEIYMGGNPLMWIDGMQWHRYDYIYDTAERRYGEMKFCTFFLNMLNNTQFRRRFTDVLCIMGGSVFQPGRVDAILTELGTRVRATMAWEGASPEGSLNEIRSAMNGRAARMAGYMKAYEHLQLADAETCQLALSANVAGAELFINSERVPYADFQGPVFLPLTITAQAPAGYRFAGWKPSADAGWYYSHAASYTLHQQSEATLVACFEPVEAVAPVVVNEVSAANSIFVNDYQKRADWVELYNTTADTIDVAGMYLSDDPARPRKCQLTAGEGGAPTRLAPHGHLVVWCDKQDGQGQLHASFKLDKDGGCVTLQAADGSWTDRLDYTAHGGEQTVGRYPDGVAEVYVMNVPTIARRNLHTSYLTTVAQTPVGLHDQPQQTAAQLQLRYVAGHLIVSGTPASAQVSVYNAAGQQVMALPVQLHGGRAQVSCRHLPAGCYVARATGEPGQQAVCKFASGQ